MAPVGTMDFFESQDVARRKTSILIFYYIIAVISIIIGVYLAFAGTFAGIKVNAGNKFLIKDLWNPELFAWIAGGTLIIVMIGSFYKIRQLAGGGASVAELLGGRPISVNTTDVNERKILNIVEEMAIASGLPVPRVFLMEDESGINAFAAGFTPSDAVVGVTRGCIDKLSRDELQGVVAHEFSHILNGDMRLNIRLMGVLHGILVIGIIGYWIFRTSLHSSPSSRSRSSKGGNKLPIILFGLLVMIIGYIGVFFGKLIKSAVSRQREYLADAAAVQFTRNPDGIAGALKKIGGFALGSAIHVSRAEEASHLFFANGLTMTFMNLMATHPPLDDRIRRLDPSFDGDFSRSMVVVDAGLSEKKSSVISPLIDSGLTKDFTVQPGDVVASVGAPSAGHLEYAYKVIATIPEPLMIATREIVGARAVIYSLLISKQPGTRDIQLRRLAQCSEKTVYDETLRILGIMPNVSCEIRLPIMDICLATLKELTLPQYESFCSDVQCLIEADNEVDLFELTIQRMIKRHMDPVFKKVKQMPVQYYDIAPLAKKCAELISCLAYWGADKEEDARTAFEKGMASLGSKIQIGMLSANECGLNLLLNVLDQLSSASHAVKKKIIEACVGCIAMDGRVTQEEAEILRCIGDSLNCPIPPFLPNQTL